MPGNAARTNQNYATLLRLRIASLSDSPTPFVPNSERGVQARNQRHPVVLSIIGRRGPLGSAVAVLLDVLSSIDRTSVGEGKSVAVRVDRGGRRRRQKQIKES